MKICRRGNGIHLDRKKGNLFPLFSIAAEHYTNLDQEEGQR
jgi:hypothetical protein